MGFRLGFGGGCAPCCGGGGGSECGVTWNARKCFVEVDATDVLVDYWAKSTTSDPTRLLRKVIVWGGASYAGKFELTKVFFGYDVFVGRFVERWEYSYPSGMKFGGIPGGATACFTLEKKLTVTVTRERVDGNPGGKCGFNIEASLPAWRFDSIVGFPATRSYLCSDFGCSSATAAAGVLSNQHSIRFNVRGGRIEEAAPAWTNAILRSDPKYWAVASGRIYVGDAAGDQYTISHTTPLDVQTNICQGFTHLPAAFSVTGNDSPKIYASFQ